MDIFERLEDINKRPEPFEFYTAADLWTDEHISEQMLAYHLDPDIDVASRQGAFIDQSVAWIGSRFSVGAGTRIADFGCGPGLYANRLARLGASVTGIDFSKRSIDHARAVAADAGLAVTYVNENYLEFETEDRFDLILMIMCDFCALSLVQRMTLLEGFQTHLAPGGCVLLDAYSANAFEKREETSSYQERPQNGFWSPKKYYEFVNTFKYDDVDVILDKVTIVEVDRTRTIYNWYQHFSKEALKSEFEKVRFTEQEFYGDVGGSPFVASASEFAIVAKR